MFDDVVSGTQIGNVASTLRRFTARVNLRSKDLSTDDQSTNQ